MCSDFLLLNVRSCRYKYYTVCCQGIVGGFSRAGASPAPTMIRLRRPARATLVVALALKAAPMADILWIPAKGLRPTALTLYEGMSDSFTVKKRRHHKKWRAR
jgi:hypothetical protein